jgi:hypothetical protein
LISNQIVSKIESAMVVYYSQLISMKETESYSYIMVASIFSCSSDCDAIRNGDDGGDTIGDGVDGSPGGYLLGITDWYIGGGFTERGHGRRMPLDEKLEWYGDGDDGGDTVGDGVNGSGGCDGKG